MDPRRLDKRLERARIRYINQKPEHQSRWEGYNLGNQDSTKRGRGRHRKPLNYVVIGLVTCLVIIAVVILTTLFVF